MRSGAWPTQRVSAMASQPARASSSRAWLGRPQRALPGLLRNGLRAGNQQAAGIEFYAQIHGQVRADAPQCRSGSGSQLSVCLVADPLSAQHQRFQLVWREHQRRQQKAGAHFKTQPGVSQNVCALIAQGANIAVERSQADVQRLGQRWPGLWLARAAQQIEQSQ